MSILAKTDPFAGIVGDLDPTETFSSPGGRKRPRSGSSLAHDDSQQQFLGEPVVLDFSSHFLTYSCSQPRNSQSTMKPSKRLLQPPGPQSFLAPSMSQSRLCASKSQPSAAELHSPTVSSDMSSTIATTSLTILNAYWNSSIVASRSALLVSSVLSNIYCSSRHVHVCLPCATILVNRYC